VSRRYRFLFGGIVAAALLLALLGRMPHTEERAAAPIAAAAAPRTALDLILEDGGVTPAVAQVAKGHEVVLAVLNRSSAAATLTLAGYEDRVALDVAPGARAEARFLADRPGEGFAWVVNGTPAGRFVVTGSHLVEGHR